MGKQKSYPASRFFSGRFKKIKRYAKQFSVFVHIYYTHFDGLLSREIPIKAFLETPFFLTPIILEQIRKSRFARFEILKPITILGFGISFPLEAERNGGKIKPPDLLSVGGFLKNLRQTESRLFRLKKWASIRSPLTLLPPLPPTHQGQKV